jgi:alkylation response protein AidB-like acyl-CoA dehydrogenase
MDFALTDTQRMLQETARRFAREELAKLAPQLEESGEPVPREWLKRYAELGFLGLNTSDELGGAGASHLDALIVLEELAKASAAAAFPVFEACTGPVRIVERFGSQALRRRVVPQVVAGDMIVAISMSEPDAGTALTDLSTRARIDGDEIVIDGAKRWCSGAGHSEGYVVFCRFSDDPGAKGIGAVFVDRDTPGLSFGPREQLMGFRGIPSADMSFEACRVPRDQLLAGPGEFGKLMQAFNLERCGNATMSLGLAAGALEQVLGYVQERRQFGRPIVEFQAVQLRLAEMATKVEAARLLVHRAAAVAPGISRRAARRDRQVLRQRDGARGGRRRPAADGRLRLRPGLRHGAAPARRLGLGHRRRHRGHPEDQHCGGARRPPFRPEGLRGWPRRLRQFPAKRSSFVGVLRTVMSRRTASRARAPSRRRKASMMRRCSWVSGVCGQGRM